MEFDDEGGLVIRLRGWKAVAAVVVALVAVVGVRVQQYSTLEEEATEQLVSHLQTAYLRPLVDEARAAMEAGAVDETRLEALAELPEIEIVEIRAKGGGSDVVARVEYRVNGEAPGPEETPKYFKMYYSTLTGWGVEYEVSALRYWMALI